jgi:hypothetical protein
MNDRRSRMIDTLTQTTGINVMVLNKYNEEYDEMITTYGVYLNLHFYDPSILEIVRLVPLLAQGHLVISEKSADQHLDQMFAPFVVWLDEIQDYKHLKEIIQQHDPIELQQRFQQTFAFQQFLPK